MKERKRADRLNQPLVLLIVALKDRVDAQYPSIWVPVIEALATVTRETDVVGWYREDRVVGAVLTQIDGGPRLDATRVTRNRITTALCHGLPADVARRLRVRVYQLRAEPKH